MQASHSETKIFSPERKLRLAYFVSHPIQYQAPMLKRIAEEHDIDLTVFFASDFSIRGHLDEGFGIAVTWDTALLNGYNYEFLPAIRSVRSGETPGFLSPINFGMRKTLKEGAFDAVWVHGYHYLAMLAAIFAANSLGIPVLLRAESNLLAEVSKSRTKRFVKRTFFKYLKPRVAAVLPIGIENANFWHHYFAEGFPSFPCHYSVDNRFFQNASDSASRAREVFREVLGLQPDRQIILFAAKLIRRKRCSDLVEAYLHLTKSLRERPAPYLLIVGDGEERRGLEARATVTDSDNIRFLGFQNQSELPSLYDLCDVFVLPSVDEPWGLAINEVMNAGRPVIVSDQVGCRADLVHNGINGWAFKAGDVGGLAERLRAVLGNNESAKLMGLASRRIVADYSFDQNVTGLRQALHSLYPGLPSSLAGL